MMQIAHYILQFIHAILTKGGAQYGSGGVLAMQSEGWVAV